MPDYSKFDRRVNAASKANGKTKVKILLNAAQIYGKIKA